MLNSNPPAKVPLPFAANGTKNAIPTASQIGVTVGKASLNDGFPPLTMTPISAGGVPPSGADFNGIFNLLSQTTQWQQAGGQFVYDATFATSIGGYPKGAMLLKATLDGQWLNTVDGNTSNPDTGGAGWFDSSIGRLISIQRFVSSGTYTPTPGTRYVRIRATAGGGGGGGCAATSSTQVAIAGGGSAGAYAEGYLANPGTQTVTIGAGGTAGGTAASGGPGGNTGLGGILVLSGGPGGPGGSAVTPPAINQSAAATSGGFVPTGFYLSIPGTSGSPAVAINTLSVASGGGGSSPMGSGQARAAPGGGGIAGPAFGSGGSGAALIASAAAASGGVGAGGIMIIEEFA